MVVGMFVHESCLVAESPRFASLRVSASSSEETSVAADELVADLKEKVILNLNLTKHGLMFLIFFFSCFL